MSKSGMRLPRKS